MFSHRKFGLYCPKGIIMFKHELKGWVLPVTFSTLFLIFFLDTLTPVGIAVYIFYFIPIAFSIFHRSPRYPLCIALLVTILSPLGYYLSPVSTVSIALIFMNRSFALISQWVVAYLVRQVIRNRNIVLENTWLKDGSNDLADKLRGEHSIREIGERSLRFLAEKTDFKVAALYLRKENSTKFEFLTGHAFMPEKDKLSIGLGEGLLGQAAIDKKISVISAPKEQQLKLSSALMEGEIHNLVLVPLVADNQTIGLMEMGFISPPHDLIITFLEQVQEAIAIYLRSAESKTKLAELLLQAQKHAEELQAQQEELRVINEELDQQTRALKESHVRLENQQAELEQTNQQLEEQAQELENQKNLLDHKNKELEFKSEEIKKSSNYKSEFLANMSHELRTPLNSSLILAKLLADNKQGNLNQEQIEYAEIIYHSGNDLLNLINDILDLSKVEAGKMNVHPEIIHTQSIAKNLEKTFAPQARLKELDFKIHVEDGIPHDFITDKQRLEQILKNFLSNAFKFTEKGGVSVHIFADKNTISFAVADTGVGISSSEQEFIFEAFRQADGTTNRKYGGTGLGLSISKELARILGGEIAVQSTKGEGSTFTLKLPLKYKETTVAPVVIPRPSPPKALKEENHRPSFSFKDDRDIIENFTRRMLIIEDDEAFAKVLFDLAHEMNFGALVAENGEEGIQLAMSFRPNAIVLDIRLPDHSGMIVLDQLKMNTKTRHIPVHVISSEDFSRSALEMGAIGYMLKPVHKEQLLVAFQNMTSVLEQELKHVLIVEDDAVQRQHISQLISDINVKVTAVETSEAALKALSQKTFDCMIMDLSLPDMSGHELLSKLSNESGTYSFPPVIVYTARDLTPEEEQKLRLYSGSIIIKGAKSPERLLSEVTLFLHKVETELPPERQKMLRDLRSREKNLEDRSIMVVDDDVRNIFALTAALEAHGAKIVTARNGHEAIQKLTPSIDMILMDIMMPEMDGHEAMKRIRLGSINKEVPILALTAKAMKDDKQKCIEAGANDYLSKPIEMDKLLSLVRVWMPHKRKFS